MTKIIFSFGRMNPPTKGHEKLIRKVVSLAKNADHMIFLSHTQNTITDPLSWDYKLTLAKMAFPSVNFCEDPEIKTPFQALEYLGRAMDYTDITMVVGDDRVEDFDAMAPYAKEWGIKKFCVVSAGRRNPRSKGIEGLSSARLRKHAYFGEESLFCDGLPNSINMFTKKQIFRDVKSALKIG
jgi:nicotinic acid mononucleotide adenylyltransferase